MAQKVPQTLPSRVHLRVPATTANLGPGYDTLGLALTLYNDILLERQEEEGISIEVEGEGKGTLPIDASNIVFQAMQSISEQAGTSLSGIKVTLINRIPLARGLGSSAAALVGGLVGANLLLGEPLPQEELVQMAVEREGHPDNVLPAFYGGGIIAVTVDGRVEWTRFSVAEQFKFVVVIPEFPVETARARAVLPPTVPHQDAVFNVQRVALLLTALAQGKADLVRVAMEDRLHQPYREQLMGPFRAVVQAARDAGADGVALSGAGPAVLAVTCRQEEEIGEAMCKPFLECGIACRSLILRVSAQGVHRVDTQ